MHYDRNIISKVGFTPAAWTTFEVETFALSFGGDSVSVKAALVGQSKMWG
jgi:hypothetical protein